MPTQSKLTNDGDALNAVEENVERVEIGRDIVVEENKQQEHEHQ